MKLLFGYLKPQGKLVFLALFLATLNQVFSMLDPWVGKNIIDHYLMKVNAYTSEAFFIGVGGWLLVGISVAMVSRIAKNFQDYFINVAMQKTGAQIFIDGIKHTLDLPYEVFEDRRSGETLNILQKVRQDSEKLALLSVNLLYTSVVGIVFVFFMSFTVHWLIAPAFLGAMVIVGIISSMLSKKIKFIQKNIVKETSALAGTTTESLRNIELVKSLGLIKQEIGRIAKNTMKILGLELEKVKKVRALGFVQGTTVNLVRNLLLLFLSYLVFKGEITPGTYIQFLFYTFFIFSPLQELGSFIQAYREADVSISNFKQLLATAPEAQPLVPKNPGDIQDVAFKKVSFKHQTAKRLALQEVSFHVKKGQTIAFVGPSGSGKSTLVKLLVGLYNPAEGQILYNNIDSHQIPKHLVRQQLGLVSQESQLFSGTIRENLLFVKPDATEQEMLDVLKKAACENLLARAENGLDTAIGEGGIKVSGGEKQRLSIARALLNHPNLLIFDEATSALDSLTEEEIAHTVRMLSEQGDQITVLIAHRLSTIMHANTIFVLEKGKIIESGTHEELLTEKGLYYAMWRQQIGESESILP